MSMYSFDKQNEKVKTGKKYNRIWLSLGNRIIGNLYFYTFLNFLNLFLIIHRISVIFFKAISYTQKQ